MPLALLDGTTAAFDFTTGDTPVSWRCVANYLSADINREMFEQTTFCNDGWRARIPGMKQLIGRLEGFASSGVAISDPLELFADNLPVPFVITLDTGCTLTGDMFATRNHQGIRAAANSEMALDFESYGPVTSTWVVA